MNATDRLTELFMRFPGIGPKQAKRFVYFLLREHSHFKEQLIKALEELKFTGKQCEKCYRFFGDKSQDNAKLICDICDTQSRVHTALGENALSEIIFALPVTDYGDVTKDYVEKTIRQIVGIEKVTMSTLARGLSSGLELEY